ncbi:uncharacterized protein LOC134404972 isoform X2 [Elgaria multicarinata webbii]|uniref:uncharacterized protein LOC134404972 isoform X2 n=1 Tax=Elgaria multicarinata webbii TaxID=159646 RepID=UPI002FCD4C41
MEASLTCAVCLSLFEEPVTLPVCSHNFCRTCVIECLGQARSDAETPPPASARPAPRSYDQPPPTRQPSGRAPRSGDGSVSVSCPLCRKLCPLPSDGGAAHLPVNTTLAEVVNLFKANLAKKATPEEASSALAPQLAALGVVCEKHPGGALQFYCRMCRRGGCGQCVSDEHSGIFHSVNLIDTVYQEEKLAFFSNLKKIRELHLKLIKEMTVPPKDARAIMQHEEELIKTEFEKVYNALEMRKKQLLEDLEIQKRRKEKENLIWKRMKEVHRKTIENVLKDCEKLLDECDPQRFLEVACSLNQRMKTQLDLMQIPSNYDENQTEYKQMQMDTTSLVNDILALSLTAVNFDASKANLTCGNSEHSVSQSPGNKWENKKIIKDTFCEVRYDYYMKHQMLSDELQTKTSPLNKRHTLPKSHSSKTTTSGFASSCLSTKTNDQRKVKMPMLQRQSVKEPSLSNSLGFTFKTQAVNFNFSGSNNNLNLLNVKESQKDSKDTCLSENTQSCLMLTKCLPSPAVALPSETVPSFTSFPNVPRSTAPPVAALSPYTSGAFVELPAPLLVSSSSGKLTMLTASKDSTLSQKKENSVYSTLFLGKSKSQDCNIKNNINEYESVSVLSTTSVTKTTTTIMSPKPGTAVSRNPFTAFSTNSESDCFHAIKPNNLEQTSFSFFLPTQEVVQGNKDACFSKNNLGHHWDNSKVTANLACKTSSSASDKTDVSEEKSVSDAVSPNNYSWASKAPCLFSFKGGLKNSSGTSTSSMMPSNKTEYAHEKTMTVTEEITALKNSVPSRNDVPVLQELKDLISHSSLFSVGKSLKSETDTQRNVACYPSANSTLVSALLTEESTPLENPSTPVEDHRIFPLITNGPSCTVNSDSDVEATSSSDSSRTSEYLSVAEDKLPS